MKERFIFLLQENIIFLRRVEASKLPCHIHKHCIHTYLTQKCICENILLFWMIFFSKLVDTSDLLGSIFLLHSVSINQRIETVRREKRQWLGESGERWSATMMSDGGKK